MRVRHHRAAALAVLVALVAPVAAVTVAAGDADADAAALRPPVHEDPRKTLDTALEVVRALWLEDGEAADAALQRLQPLTRVLDEPGDDVFGPDAVAYSQAMGTTIGRTREALLVHDYDQALNMFVWDAALVHGMPCDRQGERRGLGTRPRAGSSLRSASPAGSGSPSRSISC